MGSTKFTFEITPQLRKLIDAHPEVNWSAVLRAAITRQAEAADLARRIQDEMDDPRVQAVAAVLRDRVARRFWDDVEPGPRRGKTGRKR